MQLIDLWLAMILNVHAMSMLSPSANCLDIDAAAGLGKTATHTILMARLITKGRDYGMHAFLTPLRDAKTHHPLPGVTIGDIGPKYGSNSVDNGFARFHYYPIRKQSCSWHIALLLVNK